VILFLLFTNDVTICMELDPGIHIGNTWFVLKTGCDTIREKLFSMEFDNLGQLSHRLSR
jgi:hypothetical protein